MNIERYLYAGRSLIDIPAPENATTHVGRWQFYRADGKHKNAGEEIQKIGHLPTYAVLLLAADCLQRLDDPTALMEFDRAIDENLRDADPVRMARLYLVPEIDSDADRFVTRILEKESSFEGLMTLCALCRAATAEEVGRRARAFAARIRKVPGSDNQSFRNMLGIQVLADGDEQKCLDEAGGSALAKSQAHFTIGMLRLAKRDRPALMSSSHSPWIQTPSPPSAMNGHALHRTYRGPHLAKSTPD